MRKSCHKQLGLAKIWFRLRLGFPEYVDIRGIIVQANGIIVQVATVSVMPVATVSVCN